jgi:hypothetical protein
VNEVTLETIGFVPSTMDWVILRTKAGNVFSGEIASVDVSAIAVKLPVSSLPDPAAEATQVIAWEHVSSIVRAD